VVNFNKKKIKNMENINLEIKRMLGLLESKIGDVKPILSERIYLKEDDGAISFNTPEEWLQWISGPAGCLTSKGVTKKSQIQNIKPESVKMFMDAGIKTVKAGEPYITFDMKDKNGDEKQFLVFGRRNNQGKFNLIKRDKGKTPEFTQSVLSCEEQLKGEKSFVSDIKNLSQEQSRRVEELIGPSGAKETGFSYVKNRPESGIGTLYEPVDLNTGMGVNNNKQYIKKTSLDGLKQEFTEPGKYFIWVNLGQEVRGIDIPVEVEAMLKRMGYTRQQPSPGTPEAKNPKTVKELCKGGDCDDVLQRYANEIEGDRTIWPMNAKQKEEAKTQGITVSDYKSFVTTSASGREARKSVKDIQSQYADKDSCRAAITVLHACMSSDADDECADTINQTYSSNYKGNENEYFDTLGTLKKLVKKCDRVNLKGFLGIGGKDYETMFNELKTSTNRFSPNAQTNKASQEAGTQLEESLSRSIRLSLNEMRRKRMR
jgi:hypothetical protein